MAGRFKKAPPPSPEALENNRKAAEVRRKQAERDAKKGFIAQAVSEDRGPDLRVYKVAVDHLVHGKKKGESVTLDANKGATRALIQGGHLVPVTPTAAKSADAKGADNG
jgi:hypothetical protein